MTKPVLIKILERPPLRRLSEDEKELHMRNKWPHLLKDVVKADESTAETTASKSKEPHTTDNTYESVLKHAQQFPARFEDEIAVAMGLSTSSVSRYLKRAEEDGLIVLIRIPRGVGNTPKVVRLTQAGEQRFGKQELGKGDIAHFRYQYIDIPRFYKDNLK